MDWALEILSGVVFCKLRSYDYEDVLSELCCDILLVQSETKIPKS